LAPLKKAKKLFFFPVFGFAVSMCREKEKGDFFPELLFNDFT
jgi:hypothetical protein